LERHVSRVHITHGGRLETDSAVARCRGLMSVRAASRVLARLHPDEEKEVAGDGSRPSPDHGSANGGRPRSVQGGEAPNGKNRDLTITEVAKATGVDRRTIQRRLAQGDFPNAHRSGTGRQAAGPWFIPVTDLLAAGVTLHPPHDGEAGGDKTEPSDMAILRAEVASLRVRLAKAEAVVAGQDRAIEVHDRAIWGLTGARPWSGFTRPASTAANSAPSKDGATEPDQPTRPPEPTLAPGAPVKLTPPWEPVSLPPPRQRSWLRWWHRAPT
jgi:hypothetical protein